MVLAKKVDINPTMFDIKSGKVTRPKEIRISTEVSGLFGPMTNTTVWNTQYDHQEIKFQEDIVFQEGWLITGTKKERVMPWYIAMSHIRTISKVGGLLFKTKKYTKHRLYGSRDSHSSTVYEVVAQEPDGTERWVLLGSEHDAALWHTLTRALQEVDLGPLQVTGLQVRIARDKYYPELSLAKTIDLAREVSLRLRFNLYQVIEDIAQGDRLRARFKSFEGQELQVIKEWTESVWQTFSTTLCPRVW